MSFIPRMRYYNENQLELLKNKGFELLEKKGVKMNHQPVMELLEKQGAKVDFDSEIVLFPKKFMEEQIEKVPKQFQLKGRKEKFTLDFPHPQGLFHTRACTGGQNWLDPETNEFRRVTLKDLAYWAQLSDRLEHIDFTPFLVPDDAPSATADIYALKTLLENAEKHIWIQPYTGESVDYLIKLLKAAAGGEAKLRENPLASWITCSMSPLMFKWMDMEIILQAAGHGCALQGCSLPGSGMTGPFTAGGSVLLSAVECLAMLAVTQVVQEGTPFIATSLQFSGDMRTGKSLQSSVESLRQSALFVQLMQDAFNIPAHTYGSGSDSPDIDSQGMVERSMRAMLIASSGASVLGGAGQFEVACSVSPVALAIDNEIFKMTKAIIREMTFDDNQLAWDELMNIDYGGEFLTCVHTLKNCREVIRPINFTRLTRDSWADTGSKDLNTRVSEYLGNLMKDAGPIELSLETKKEMAAIIKQADEKLC
ncbi:MAG: trimethylamine methyltransferase family protein [Deltaproteobacteria bacterium]|nr:trimethylamine methyltransferase family protein [Candidatus Desulfobacula maris]